MTNSEQLTALCLENGAYKAAVIPVEEIPFRPELRAACEANACGAYGKNWMCPPLVGEIGALIERAKSYRYALVFQTVGQLEDSFDFEGMTAAGAAHNEVEARITVQVEPLLRPQGWLVLSAGGCPVCSECAAVQNEPCRFPERARASLEAYGIAVSELAALCGMKYINGANTVTYFGAYLFGQGAPNGEK